MPDPYRRYRTGRYGNRPGALLPDRVPCLLRRFDAPSTIFFLISPSPHFLPALSSLSPSSPLPLPPRRMTHSSSFLILHASLFCHVDLSGHWGALIFERVS